MSCKKLSEAFTIFAKYEGDGYIETASEHDVIYSGPEGGVVSEEDTKRLDKLGWDFDEENNCWVYYTC